MSSQQSSAGRSATRVRRVLLAGLFLFGFWSLVIAAFAAQLVFTAEFPWTRAFQEAMFDWLPWVVASPTVIWLARRFPLERGRLRWGIPVHAIGCLLAVLFCAFISDQIAPRPRGPGWDRVGHLAPIGGEGRFARPLIRAAEPGAQPGGVRPLPVPPPAPESSDGRGPANRPAPRRDDTWHLLTFAFVGRSSFNIPVYWVIVSVVHAFSFYRRMQERERRTLELSASLSQAKLHALRLQMQPHFLFNTLNALSTLVHKDANRADEMIVNLGELLRLSLDATDQEVPLRRELEMLDRYLEIEQVRLGDRLRFRRTVEPQVMEALVPTLLIQTIVENAVRHGVEPRRETGTIDFRATRVEDTLRLQVRDDGAGLRPADRASDRRGIGLVNTESRLAELYGSAGNMVLREPAGGGVSVEITIPYHTQPSTREPKS